LTPLKKVSGTLGRVPDTFFNALEPAMRIRARHYATGQLIDCVCAGGLIQSVSTPGPDLPDREVGWLAPALFDLQINGCDGLAFKDPGLPPAGKIYCTA
jgi:N-acetylglucosamine-6-phosphate deacetylase